MKKTLDKAVKEIGQYRSEIESKLLEFADSDADVADPWYTGNFEVTYRDVLAGCKGLLTYVDKK